MPKREPSSSPSPGPSAPKKRGGPSWHPEEDAAVVSAMQQNPRPKWDAIAEIVNALNHVDKPRTGNSVRQHWNKTLKHDDPSTEQLSDVEKGFLQKAVKDLETGADKWFFMAARYVELKKAKDARELGKGGVKRWFDVLKKRGDFDS